MKRRRRGVVGESIVVDMYGMEHLESEVEYGRWGGQKGRVVNRRDLDRPSTHDLKQPRPREYPRPRIVTPQPDYPDES